MENRKTINSKQIRPAVTLSGSICVRQIDEEPKRGLAQAEILYQEMLLNFADQKDNLFRYEQDYSPQNLVNAAFFFFFFFFCWLAT